MKSNKAVSLGSLIEDALALVLQGSSDDEDNTETEVTGDLRGDGTRMCRPFGRHPHRHTHGRHKLYYPREYGERTEDIRYAEREIPAIRYPKINDDGLIEAATYYGERDISDQARKPKVQEYAVNEREDEETLGMGPTKPEPENIPGSIMVMKQAVILRNRFMAQDYMHRGNNTQSSLASIDGTSPKKSRRVSFKQNTRKDDRRNSRSSRSSMGSSHSSERDRRDEYDQREDYETSSRTRRPVSNRPLSRHRSRRPSNMDPLSEDTSLQRNRFYDVEEQDSYDQREVYDGEVYDVSSKTNGSTFNRPTSRPRGRRTSNMDPMPEESSFQSERRYGMDPPQGYYRRSCFGRSRSEGRSRRYRDECDDDELQNARQYKHSSQHSLRDGSVSSTVVEKSKACLGMRK